MTMLKVVFRTAAVLLTFGLFAGSAAAADVKTIDERLTLQISYRDLNLDSEGGTRVLYRRIVAAAARVCPDERKGDLRAHVRANQCRTEAIERAVAGVNRPQLAAMLNAHARTRMVVR